MAARKLLILTTSFKRNEEITDPIRAIERYDGVYFKILRKHLREGKLKNTDILIVTEKRGLIWSNDKVPLYKIGGKMGFLSLDEKTIEKLRHKNLKKIGEILSQNRYSEIYVNVGKQYMKLIEGFEEFAPCKLTYAKGGLGEKATHMRDWILSRT